MTEISPLPARTEPAAVSLWLIFIAFTRTALMAIGGGVSGWMMREFVDNRQWLSEREFLTGLALSQAFPGVNVVNLSIWIGYHMRGGPGALAAALGTIVPPGILAIITVSVFDKLAEYQPVVAVISGIAAAAIGMTLTMGVKALRSTATHLVPIAIIIAMVGALFFLHWPLIPVLLVLVPISIGAAFWRIRQEERQ